MKQYKVIIIGAGGRGINYAQKMQLMPEKYTVVGVADILEERRNDIKKMWNLSEENCFESWEDILNRPKFADIAVIATMDHLHYEPAMKAIELGYNLLLEKPVAQTAKECMDIALAAKKHNVQVLVCHVLRYTPFYSKIKKLLLDGIIGNIMSLIAVEGVGHIHYSHSYARGDWHKEAEASPMLLAKCCHDLDIIQWLIGKPCKKVSSFGELTHFKPENAPEGAPKRCIDEGCPAADTCPYHYKKIYLEEDSAYWWRNTVARGFAKGYMATDEEVLTGLKNTNFGSCIYHAGNDVVDHQVVNMEFEGGTTASLNMNAFNEGGRYIRIFGTKGELYANASDAEITIFSFDTLEKIHIPVTQIGESIMDGHGGGDQGIIIEMYDYFSGSYTGYCAADIETSVQNHMIGFAAEKARRNDTVEYVSDFINSMK